MSGQFFASFGLSSRKLNRFSFGVCIYLLLKKGVESGISSNFHRFGTPLPLRWFEALDECSWLGGFAIPVGAGSLYGYRA